MPTTNNPNDTPKIIELQSAPSVPVPNALSSQTDMLLSPKRTSDRLAHFPEEVYNLSSEGHLVKFIKVLLGDAGAGQVRKSYLLKRLQSNLSGTHFVDLDRFYGALFNVKRLSEEKLTLDPTTAVATSDVWDSEFAKDSSYRSRIEQFAKALPYGATPSGMELVSEALLAVDCDVYESFIQADNSYQTFGEVESQYPKMSDLEGTSWGTLEGAGLHRLAGDERRLFVIRPKRQITQEEAYALTRVLTQLKPAESRFVIETQGVDVHELCPIRGVAADSIYWEITPQVATRPTNSALQPYTIPSESPTEQPRPPFSSYQGEAWSYNSDISGFTAYTQADGSTSSFAMPTQRVVFNDGSLLDYYPQYVVLSQKYVQAGRNVSDGILTVHPYSNELYADRIPLKALTTSLATPGADPFDVVQGNRYWVTPQRDMGNRTAEIIEARFAQAHLMNYVSFQVAHYPQHVSVQIFNNQNSNWDEVYSQVITDSVPKYLSPASTLPPGSGNPQHDLPNHWVNISTRINSVLAARMRVVLTRTDGIPPRLPRRYSTYRQAVQVQENVSVDYSLAVKNLDVGYRINSFSDVPSTPILGTSVDVLGSLTQFTLNQKEPKGALTLSGKPWKCEPQPFNYAIVNFFADTRDELGDGQTIDKFYVDPTHNGAHVSIYYSNDDIVQVATPLNLMSLSDASLESDIGSWKNDNNATISRSNVGVTDGVVALRITATGNGPVVRTDLTSQGQIPVSGSTQYTFIGNFRPTASQGRAQVGVRWFDQNHSTIGTDIFSTGITMVIGESLQDSLTTISPVSAVYAEMVLFFSDAINGDIIDADSFGVFEGDNTVWYSPEAPAIQPMNEESLKDFVWTPIPRDYVLQKGYMTVPPTKAKYWKFEMTNLVAEPYEALVPIRRTVKLFTPQQVAESLRGNSGISQENMPAGTAASITLSQNQWYLDAYQVITNYNPRTDGYSPTEALYASDPQAATRLGDAAWFYNFTPWHQGDAAPRFIREQQHVYTEVEVFTANKTAYFVGLNLLQAFRIKYEADDDSEIIYDRFWDFRNIKPGFTWTFNPNSLSTVNSTSCQATSRTINSRHNIEAVQFATQQSDPVQLVPDDDFRDPALATYDWTNADSWTKIGDAQLIYSPSDHSVQMLRHVIPQQRAINRTGGLVQGLVQPVFSYRPFTVEDTEAEASSNGGIQSALLGPSSDGRIYAAARVIANDDITVPLVLQIVSGATDQVLAEKAITAHEGEMVEWYIGYDINSANPITADDTIRVRLVQIGKATNTWKLDTLSLFDEGIVWDFSVDGGNTFYTARGIRNNPNAVVSFPTAGNELVWRVRGVRQYMAVNALQIRPWYVGLQNARVDGTHRGPNVSVYDQSPPIQEDPEFQGWDKPIPRRWFYVTKRFPLLPVTDAPNVTQFARFYGRPVTDDLTDTMTDMAVGRKTFVRTGTEDMYFFQPLSEAATRQGVFHRSISDATTGVIDSAQALINPSGSNRIVNIPVHPD